MTYGWVLILVATAVGVLVFLMGSPSDIVFSSDSPNKILLRAGAMQGSVADAVLQNITGGAIEVTDLTVVQGNYSNCQLNEQVPSQGTPVSVIAGGTMELTCDLAGEDPTGSIMVSYSDFANLPQTATVRISSGASGSGGGFEPPTIECSSVSLDAPGVYTLPGDVSDHDGDCFTISSSDVTLDCDGHTIDGTGSGNAITLGNDLQNIVIRNCIISDFSRGIYAINNQQLTIEDNVFNSTNGMSWWFLDNSEIKNNVFNTPGYGIYFRRNDNDVSYNEFNNCTKAIWLYAVDNSYFGYNNITGCDGGIISESIVDNCVFEGNRIVDGDIAIEFFQDTGNTFKDNFINGNNCGFCIYEDAGDHTYFFENNDLCGADGQVDWYDYYNCANMIASGDSKWNDGSTCNGVTNLGCP